MIVTVTTIYVWVCPDCGRHNHEKGMTYGSEIVCFWCSGKFTADIQLGTETGA